MVCLKAVMWTPGLLNRPSFENLQECHNHRGKPIHATSRKGAPEEGIQNEQLKCRSACAYPALDCSFCISLPPCVISIIMTFSENFISHVA